MAEEQKNFNTAAPMLFGEEFVKQLPTATVEQVKAIKKLNIPEERKVFFPGTTLEATKAIMRVATRAAKFQPPHKGSSNNQAHPPQLPRKPSRTKEQLYTHNCKLSKSNHKLSLYFRLRCSHRRS